MEGSLCPESPDAVWSLRVTDSPGIHFPTALRSSPPNTSWKIPRGVLSPAFYRSLTRSPWYRILSLYLRFSATSIPFPIFFPPPSSISPVPITPRLSWFAVPSLHPFTLGGAFTNRSPLPPGPIFFQGYRQYPPLCFFFSLCNSHVPFATCTVATFHFRFL